MHSLDSSWCSSVATSAVVKTCEHRGDAIPADIGSSPSHCALNKSPTISAGPTPAVITHCLSKEYHPVPYTSPCLLFKVNLEQSFLRDLATVATCSCICNDYYGRHYERTTHFSESVLADG